MASIGLGHNAEIDSIGDTVTGDLETCWKCQQGTHARAESGQFYRICVSQTRWLDSDGRPRWPRRVMRACQCETGLKCRLQGEYYIMLEGRLPGQQQSSSLCRLRPFYYRMDGWTRLLWDDPDRCTQGEVRVHYCISMPAQQISLCQPPYSFLFTWRQSEAWEWFNKPGIASTYKSNILTIEIITMYNK